MSNPNRARGLLPFERVMRESKYQAGGTVYPGDPVKVNSSGQVVAASAGDALIGVAAQYQTSGNDVMVWDDPAQKYEAQVHTGTSIAQTHVGNNFDILANSADTTYRQSRVEVDGSTAATTSTLALRMLAISPALDNAAGDRAKVIVVINNGQLRSGVAGV